MNLRRFTARMAAICGLCAATANADIINVTNDVTGAKTWYATNEYVLETVVYVHSNAVLSIEPGTVIKGSTDAGSLIPRDGIPNLVSALWVARGGQLYATGTVDQPIIFTYNGDDVSDPNDVPYGTVGQWGGIVMMGNAVINSSKDVAGSAATPLYDVYEGVTTDGTNNAHRFGGNDDNDSSGTLRYVSIRYPGNVFAPNAELNGLTMGGVGKGTTIEYVEVLNGSDDGFEWWGGCVDTKYLVAAFIEDDCFDTDQGYRGTNQFWLGINAPWNGTSDSRGFEVDGDLDQGNTGELPISQWAVYNATLIGRGTNVVLFGGGSAYNSRDEAAPSVYNSIFSDYNKGLKLDTDGLLYYTNNPALADLRNSLFYAASALDGANGQYLFTKAAYANTLVGAPVITSVSYTNDLGLNPRPFAGSAALTNALAGAPMAASYRGAFSGPGDNWADTWTALSQLGILKAAAPTVVQSIVRNGDSVDISFATQIGSSYQLQSRSAITGAWSNSGSPVAGTGSFESITVPLTGDAEYFRVEVQ